MSPRPRLAAALLAGLVLVGGCGERSSGADDAGGDDPGAAGRTEATTPEALAAAVAAHLDVEPLSYTRRASGADDAVPEGAVTVSMRVPMTPDDDQGALLSVAVGPGPEDLTCPADISPSDGCEVREGPDGAEVQQRWQTEEPEEDPGVLYLSANRPTLGDSVVSLYLSGPTIPEDLTATTDLELLSVPELDEVLADPLVGPTTTPAGIEAGEAIDDRLWTEEPY